MAVVTVLGVGEVLAAVLLLHRVCVSVDGVGLYLLSATALQILMNVRQLAPPSRTRQISRLRCARWVEDVMGVPPLSDIF